MHQYQTMYVCGGRKFLTLNEAEQYANKVFKKQGVILGIELL